jgi:hypothetical protein
VAIDRDGAKTTRDDYEEPTIIDLGTLQDLTRGQMNAGADNKLINSGQA